MKKFSDTSKAFMSTLSAQASSGSTSALRWVSRWFSVSPLLSPRTAAKAWVLPERGVGTLWTFGWIPLGFCGVSGKLGFVPAWLKRLELRDPASPLQGPLVPGHPSAEAGPGGLGLPRDPAGVPRAAELHRARQAQGETAGPPEYGNGSATHGGGRGGAGLSEWDGECDQSPGLLPSGSVFASEVPAPRKCGAASTGGMFTVRPF